MRRLWCLLPAVALLAAACGPAAPTITPEQAKAFASVNAAANAGLLGSSAGPDATSAKLLDVVGDSYATTGMGGDGASVWPALLAAKLGWSLHLDAGAQTGYVAGGTTTVPNPFTSRLASVVAARPTGIIVFGSRYDVHASQAEIQAAASTLLTGLKARLPNVPVVVIGPLWPTDMAPQVSPSQRAGAIAAVQAAAKAAGDPFVDPVGQGWFNASNATLISSNHLDLTPAGQAYLAQRIESALTTVAAGKFPTVG